MNTCSSTNDQAVCALEGTVARFSGREHVTSIAFAGCKRQIYSCKGACGRNRNYLLALITRVICISVVGAVVLWFVT